MEELEYITFSVDTEKLEERVITGLAAPYGVLSGDARKQGFAPGSFGDLADDVKLNFNHDQNAIIGSVFESEDTEAGLVIKARISKSARGEEVYTLLREGHLNKFSVGIQGREFREDDGNKIWTKVDLHEVSVVPRPAFKTAAITAVYSAQADSTTEMEIDDSTMSDEINTKVGELTEAFSDLERKVSLLGTQAPAEEVKIEKFSSAAEAVKASAAGDKEAFAYTGQTLTGNPAATRPAWLSRELKLVEAKRPVTNLFNRGPLPATGMSFTYPQVGAVSGTVTAHVEGADLPFLGASIGTATADIKVYGGYTSLSRELIERSDVPVLDVHLRHLFNEYAKASEKAVRDAFVGATGTQTGTLAAETAAGYVGMVLDAAAKIEDNALGAVAEVVVVSRDVFTRMATIVDSTGRPLFDVNGDGSNTVGNVSVTRVAGTLAGYPVVVIPTLPANSIRVVSSDALTVRGDDTPRSLQDENIINLTKDFSVYGYLSVEVNNPIAIVKVTKAA